MYRDGLPFLPQIQSHAEEIRQHPAFRKIQEAAGLFDSFSTIRVDIWYTVYVRTKEPGHTNELTRQKMLRDPELAIKWMEKAGLSGIIVPEPVLDLGLDEGVIISIARDSIVSAGDEALKRELADSVEDKPLDLGQGLLLDPRKPAEPHEGDIDILTV